MKRYKVIFTASAQADIERSYGWGSRKWGKEQAQAWVRELRKISSHQLAVIPQGFPLAPENEEAPVEIRQLIVGRYRVLFTIKEKNVFVLHVRGAFSDRTKAESSEE